MENPAGLLTLLLLSLVCSEEIDTTVDWTLPEFYSTYNSLPLGNKIYYF